MSNFVQNCINGDALLSEVYNYIENWHNGSDETELHEYLGMTQNEYGLFVEDETYLGAIVNAHINGMGIEEQVEKLSLAARSVSQEKSRRIEKWLSDEGLWKK